MDPFNPIIAAHAAARPQRGIDTWPPALWLGLQALALWPVGRWTVQRWADGSDEPLGIVALMLLGVAAASGRLVLQRTPRTGWLVAAMGFSVAAAIAGTSLPPLATGVLGACALACAWAAWRARRAPVGPVLGLLLLVLPLVASLQYVAGYPLRVLTAQGSAWLLQAGGIDALRSGATLAVDGRLVIVDAPCSGVQLVWFGYAAACAAALWARVPERSFWRRLPAVGVLVLAGNVLRNSVLVAQEAGRLPAPAWSHDAIGLGALAVVCALVIAWMQRDGRDAT